MLYRLVKQFVLAAALAVIAWGASRSAQGDLRAAANPVLPPLTIYTSKNAPPAPSVDALEKRKSISQYGITWTFDKEVPVGQFITGDWYVVGQASVINIDPKPLWGDDVVEPPIDKVSVHESKYPGKRARNGSEINPPNVRRPGHYPDAGFDSRIPSDRYAPELFAHLPIAMKPGDVLLSTISRNNTEIKEFSGQHVDAIRSCAVLTCLAEPVAADAFRPSYCDAAHGKNYLARNISHRDALLNLPRMPDMPHDLGACAVKFQRPCEALCDYGMSAPLENMPHYGQQMNEEIGEATLLLQMDYTPAQKERLLVNMIQTGIDLWGQVRSGYSWIADGGINQGRKWPILFAGMMLDDQDMQSPKKLYPKCRFEENDETGLCPYTYKGKVYDQCWTGAKAFYVGHSPWDADKSEGPVGKWEEGWGPLELFPPSEWPLPGKLILGSDGYRVANSSPAWVGLALGIRLMHQEKLWDHDAFFAYVDRWMTEDDTTQVRALKEAGRQDRSKAKFGEFGRQGYLSNDAKRSGWVKDMWNKYRDNMPPAGDGTKTPEAQTTWK